jgi:hypothetical protein
VQHDFRLPAKAHEVEAEIPSVVDRRPMKTPAEQYATLLSHGGSAAAHALVQGEAVSERREVSLEDWATPARRGWMVYAIAAAVVVAVGVTGWMLFGRGALASRAAAASAPPSQVRPTDASLAAKSGPVVKDSAAADAQTGVKSDGAQPAPENASAQRAGRSNASADQQDGSAAAIPRRSQAALPTVNLDRITKAIEDSARLRVDSAGRALNVAPPTFKTRPPSPP